MPLQRCGEGNKGWRWGEKGQCYSGPNAKKKAIKQGLAENEGELPDEEADGASIAEIEEAKAEFRNERVGANHYIEGVRDFFGFGRGAASGVPADEKKPSISG